MDWFGMMQAFCRTADTGSLSEAARHLGISRSVVSRRIAALEAELGGQLLHRTTRSLSLTEAGNAYYPEAERILAALDESRSLLRKEVGVPKGLVRIGIPASFGERYVIPEIPSFLEAYSEVRLSFLISESLADLHRDELDLVVRIGDLPDSTLTGIRLFRNRMVLCAAPKYLSGRSAIEEPVDLRDHNCLCYRGRGRGERWQFSWNGDDVSVRVGGNLTADSGTALRDLGVAGVGILRIPHCLVAEELASGVLVPILPAATDERFIGSTWIVYHPDRTLPLRVQALIDFLRSPQRRFNRLKV